MGHEAQLGATAVTAACDALLAPDTRRLSVGHTTRGRLRAAFFVAEIAMLPWLSIRQYGNGATAICVCSARFCTPKVHPMPDVRPAPPPHHLN